MAAAGLVDGAAVLVEAVAEDAAAVLEAEAVVGVEAVAEPPEGGGNLAMDGSSRRKLVLQKS